MHETPIRVDHVGIAVESVDEAEPVLHALGCTKGSDETGHDGSYRWVTYHLGNASRLELVTPLRDDSFIQRFLDANGPGLHHVTFEVADIDAVVDSLGAAGVSVVDRATHDGYAEAFVSPRNPTGALFQLMEYHDDYAAVYGDPDELFIGGARVGEHDE
jgi:methylmalonyl-CoA/ethylmalonyl-CoA epimerase